MHEDQIRVLLSLERWGRARDWVGPDPYEGLNSPLGRLARSRRPRQAVTQAYKLLPIRPPGPLRAAPRPNAKAFALALSAYSSPAGRDLPGADEYLSRLPSTLEGMNLQSTGAAWGYHFDVQTRNLFYDASTPNVIATTFVVHALCDAAQATGEEGWAQLALRARAFLLSLLSPSPHGRHFAYIPLGEPPLIHNANMLACGALARLDSIDPSRQACDALEEAAATTIALQRADGLWDYGEAPNFRWADNFHTAYTLDGLLRVQRGFGLGADSLSRGLEAWRREFFGEDGWARYYAANHFPLEAHCAASAIDLLCLAGGSEEVTFAELIAASAIRELWLEGPGRFAFKRTRRGLNKREFMRWTNAPFFRALALLAGAGGQAP